MSGKVSLATFAAAILLGFAPIEAQVRSAPVRMVAPSARPVLLTNRIITSARPAPAVRTISPPVRVIGSPVRVVRLESQQPAMNAVPTGASAAPAVTVASPVAVNTGGTPIPLWQLLNQAPGLGFDFNHLAAIDSNLAVRAIIDPVTQQEISLAEQLPTEQPIGLGWGYFPAYGEAGYMPAQPQVIVLQEPAPQAVPVPQAAPTPIKEQAAAPPVPPLPSPGEFLLVRRDGKVIRAVGFSQQGSQIIYITSAGLRRAVALDQLDLKATEERNAERGSILHFSN